MGMSIERVSSKRSLVGECPVFNALDGCWYWVDIVARTIWRLDGDGALRSWLCGEMVACIAPARDGSILAGMETGVFRLLLQDDGSVEAARLAAPEALGEGMRFNDGRCDRQGRFWSGTMFMDMAAERAIGSCTGTRRARACPDRCLRPADPERPGLLAGRPHDVPVRFASGQPAGVGLRLRHRGRMPSNRRAFVDMRAHPGRPDGAAVDADGCYWTCGNDAGLPAALHAGRETLDRTIELPMAKPSMCSFGGPDLDSLLVTSISAGQDPARPMLGRRDDHAAVPAVQGG
jgi:sugar lactone lactonase YvrE